MTFFRRKKDRPQPEAADQTEVEVVAVEDEPEVVGPKDSGGRPAPKGYVDLGSLYVPSVSGMQLRAQFESDKETVRRILLIVGTSGIQVTVAAAPRSGGVWDELREQIQTSFVQAGGKAEIVEGRYGKEIRGLTAVKLPNGATGMSPVRIIGIEGPRWLVRIDIQGAAAAGDEEQAANCDEIIDQLIIHRGSEPRVRLEGLPMRLPREKRVTERDD